MSNESYTEVTSTNWFQRLGNSFKGIITGIVLILVASYGIYYNEGRTVREAGAIAEAELLTVDMPNIDSVDSSFNGKLVYAKGEAKTNDVLSDSTMGISTNGIRLSRSVKFYQWVESSKTETVKHAGGTEEKITTYSYAKSWVSNPVDSSGFKKPAGHQNHIIFQSSVKNETWLAQNVSFGAYSLPSFLIASISKNQPLNIELTQDQIQNINQGLHIGQQNMYNNQMGYQNNQNQMGYQNNQNQMGYQNNQMGMQQNQMGYQNNQMGMQQNQMGYQNNQMGMQNQNRVHVSGNEIYLGLSKATPEIGDMMITYSKTGNTNISLIAQVSGSTFEKFIASNGNDFYELSNNQESKQSLFQGAKDANSMMAWIIRIICVLVVIAGFKMIFAPLVILADILPFLGSLVAFGTGIISSILGIAWSLIIFALSWIRFRPILAISLLAIALVLVIFIIMRGKSKKTEQAPEASA